MSAIMITCPETGIEVPVGIDTDEASFQKIPRGSRDDDVPGVRQGA